MNAFFPTAKTKATTYNKNKVLWIFCRLSRNAGG